MAKFDFDSLPDADEASAGGFDFDSLPDADADETPSAWEVGARGVAQGALFGFPDELAGFGGAIADKISQGGDFADLYAKNRDESRSKYQAAQEANPALYTAGEIGGAVGTAFVPGLGALNAAKGAGLATRAGLAAAQGGLSGLGLSNEESIGGLAKDTAIGAGLGASLPLAGAALRPVAGKAANYVGQKLGTFAEKAAVNATGATGKQASEFADDAGRQLLDRGIVQAGDSQANIAGRAAKAVQAANQQIDNSLSTLEAKGVAVDANDVYNTLRAKITELKGDPSQADVARMLENELDNLISATEARGSTEIGIGAAEKWKRGYNRKAGNWADPEKGMVGKEMYQTYRGAVENAAEAADPATAALFKEGKESYGLLAPIQEAAERRAATTSQSPVGGFLDVTTAAAEMATGGPGIVAPIARRLISPRISSTVAVGADKVSKMLLKSPQMQQMAQKNPAAFQALVHQFESKMSSQPTMPRAAEQQETANFKNTLGKDALLQKTQGSRYGQLLQNAAQKGDQSLAAAHYVLHARDPQYRKITGE